MKKQSLLFLAGAVLALASCQPEGADGDYTQAQVDSMVNARVADEMLVLQMQNDSIINAMAALKADSIIAAMKGGNAVTTKTTTTRTTTVNNGGTTTKTPTNPKDDRFDGTTPSNTDQKNARFDEDAAQKVKEENAKKKADRFNK